MAIVKFDPVFKEETGRTGNFVFYKWKGIQCMRIYVIPHNPDTEKQRAVRHTFGDAVRSWKALSSDEKDIWNRRASKMKKVMSGYNLYISDFMKKNKADNLRADTDPGT